MYNTILRFYATTSIVIMGDCCLFTVSLIHSCNLLLALWKAIILSTCKAFILKTCTVEFALEPQIKQMLLLLLPIMPIGIVPYAFTLVFRGRTFVETAVNYWQSVFDITCW